MVLDALPSRSSAACSPAASSAWSPPRPAGRLDRRPALAVRLLRRRRSPPTTTCPVLSWLLLSGHCRSCGARIPARYPLIELAVGAAFAATAIVLARRPAEARARTALRRAARGDHADRPRAPGDPQRDPARRRAVAGRRRRRHRSGAACPSGLLAAWRRAASCSSIALVYPRGMGMGDVKLAAVMGLYLGARGRSGAVGRRPLRGPRRDRADARPRIASAQARDPVRPVPRTRRRRRAAGGQELINAYLNAFVH